MLRIPASSIIPARTSRRRIGGLLPLAVTLLLIAPGRAVHADAPDAQPVSALPVKAVTLFSSGVSYTMREGDVTGDATVPLTFRTTQINDILKSLVLIDDKGTVRPAIYAAKDPIGRTLQSFAVDVSQPTDRTALLNRLKGSRVAVEGGGTVIAASTMTPTFKIEGQIVGVDREDGSYGGNVLSLLGDDGLQTVRLNEVRSIRFLDERINREFREALGLMASGSDDKRRQVTLHFDGTGTRKVHVGYVSEAPLWKISYRLLIGGAAGQSEAKAYLQGQALVENTTDEDWNGIRLSLVSGRPVSFIQDLYQPLYLPRPVVPPDVIASPFPQLAEANIEEPKNSPQVAAGGASFGGGGGQGGGGIGYGMAPMAKASSSRSLRPEGVQQVISNDSDNSLLVEYDAAKASMATQASGQKSGELFAYRIDTPVTLPRQQAAMIPVVADDIDGEKVSLYNADTDPRFPMNAFRLRNSTALHLKGGPITIFDGGVYAGDARMEDIPPGDSRLLTYAVDLAVEGERQPTTTTGLQTEVVVHRGVMTIKHHEQRATTYTFRNKAGKPRLIIVEHPFDANCHLVQPAKADSRTPSHYRFEVPVAAGKTEKLNVVTDQPVSETVALLGVDVPALEVYIAREGISDKMKAVLRDLVARRRKVQDLQSQAATVDEQVKSTDADQDRIRRNMSELDRNSALYKRYVEQLDAQETRIQSLRVDSTRLKGEAAQADRDLKAFIDNLDATS